MEIEGYGIETPDSVFALKIVKFSEMTKTSTVCFANCSVSPFVLGPWGSAVGESAGKIASVPHCDLGIEATASLRWK